MFGFFCWANAGKATESRNARRIKEVRVILFIFGPRLNIRWYNDLHSYGEWYRLDRRG